MSRSRATGRRSRRSGTLRSVGRFGDRAGTGTRRRGRLRVRLALGLAGTWLARRLRVVWHRIRPTGNRPGAPGKVLWSSLPSLLAAVLPSTPADRPRVERGRLGNGPWQRGRGLAPQSASHTGKRPSVQELDRSGLGKDCTQRSLRDLSCLLSAWAEEQRSGFPLQLPLYARRRRAERACWQRGRVRAVLGSEFRRTSLGEDFGTALWAGVVRFAFPSVAGHRLPAVRAIVSNLGRAADRRLGVLAQHGGGTVGRFVAGDHRTALSHDPHGAVFGVESPSGSVIVRAAFGLRPGADSDRSPRAGRSGEAA